MRTAIATALMSSIAGCGAVSAPTALYHGVYTATECASGTCKFDPQGILGLTGSFFPSASGKTITITLTGSSPNMRIPVRCRYGGALVAEEDNPSGPITVVSFIVTGIDLNGAVFSSFPRGTVPGDTVTVDVIEQ